MTDRRFAVLIDSDNISQKYCQYILDEIAEYGIATYKRIYGDWTNPRNNWKEVLLKHSISPIQQYSYTTGKNATDSAMIIDAMDILYTGHVEGFCIVSSDSDFTRLAARLRESGMMVIGMGEKKTPEPFRVACEKFIYLDVLADEDVESDDTQDKAVIGEAIIKIITENENKSRKTGIGEVGSRLSKIYSDFDVRNYGYAKLSTFLESFGSIKLEKQDSTYYVSMVTKKQPEKNIEQKVLEILKSAKKNTMNVGELSQKLKEEIPGFHIRDYGYSKFKKFLESFSSIQVKEQNVSIK